jgi:sulfur relay (sulfurtransferase) DsrC/TusE family protein
MFRLSKKAEHNIDFSKLVQIGKEIVSKPMEKVANTLNIFKQPENKEIPLSGSFGFGREIQTLGLNPNQVLRTTINALERKASKMKLVSPQIRYLKSDLKQEKQGLNGVITYVLSFVDSVGCPRSVYSDVKIENGKVAEPTVFYDSTSKEYPFDDNGMKDFIGTVSYGLPDGTNKVEKDVIPTSHPSLASKSEVFIKKSGNPIPPSTTMGFSEVMEFALKAEEDPAIQEKWEKFQHYLDTGRFIDALKILKEVTGKEVVVASLKKISYIRKTPGKQEWCVFSSKGKNLGCFETETEAKKRLQQIEYFKHKGADEFDLLKLADGAAAIIIKTPGKWEWCVVSRDGKEFGCYSSMAQAKRMLRHLANKTGDLQKEIVTDEIDSSDSLLEVLTKGKGKLPRKSSLKTASEVAEIREKQITDRDRILQIINRAGIIKIDELVDKYKKQYLPKTEREVVEKIVLDNVEQLVTGNMIQYNPGAEELKALSRKYAEEEQTNQLGKELEMGTKVEEEHADTIEWLKDYYEKYKTWPPDEEVFKNIAKDHLEEFKDYYTRLKKMESEKTPTETKEVREPEVIASLKRSAEQVIAYRDYSIYVRPNGKIDIETPIGVYLTSGVKSVDAAKEVIDDIIRAEELAGTRERAPVGVNPREKTSAEEPIKSFPELKQKWEEQKQKEKAEKPKPKGFADSGSPYRGTPLSQIPGTLNNQIAETQFISRMEGMGIDEIKSELSSMIDKAEEQGSFTPEKARFLKMKFDEHTEKEPLMFHVTNMYLRGEGLGTKLWKEEDDKMRRLAQSLEEPLEEVEESEAELSEKMMKDSIEVSEAMGFSEDQILDMLREVYGLEPEHASFVYEKYRTANLKEAGVIPGVPDGTGPWGGGRGPGRGMGPERGGRPLTDEERLKRHKMRFPEDKVETIEDLPPRGTGLKKQEPGTVPSHNKETTFPYGGEMYGPNEYSPENVASLKRKAEDAIKPSEKKDTEDQNVTLKIIKKDPTGKAEYVVANKKEEMETELTKLTTKLAKEGLTPTEQMDLEILQKRAGIITGQGKKKNDKCDEKCAYFVPAGTRVDANTAYLKNSCDLWKTAIENVEFIHGACLPKSIRYQSTLPGGESGINQWR